MTDLNQAQIRQLDGTLLLVLQALIRERKTTLVAERLGLSPSAISHALTRLRRLLGDPLFVRRPHGLEPTQHALALSPRIDALIAQAADLLGSRAGFDPATASHSFRLGASDFLANVLSPTLLQVFQAEAPNCRFAFALSLGDAALRQLRHDQIDLAVGRFQGALDGLPATRLFTDDYCLVTRKGHPVRDVDAQALQALNHVAVSVTGDFRTFTERDFLARGLQRRIVAAAPRFTIAFAMVAATDAACVAPRRLALACADAYGLEVRDLPAPLPSIDVLAVRRASPDAGVDWLLRKLEEIAARPATESGVPACDE